MFATHPLYAPVMGLAPLVDFVWKDGPESGHVFPDTGKVLIHRVADLGALPIRADALTDGLAVYAVGYGFGPAFDDHCFDPMGIESLCAEAVALHLHQMVAFLAMGVDPLPFAEPLKARNPLALSAYVAKHSQRPEQAMGTGERAVMRLVACFGEAACAG